MQNLCRARSFFLIAALSLLARTSSADLSELIAGFPVDTAAKRDELCKQLIASGPGSIQELTKMLVAPGAGDDRKARLALYGVAIYASREGGEADRKIFAQAAGDALSSNLAPAAKTYLMELLRMSGGQEAVAPLGKLLLDKELCDGAVQSLLAIQHDAARATLRKALPEAQGAPRALIVKALGTLRDQESVPALVADCANADATVRIAALHALGNIGDPAASAPLLKAAVGPNADERAHAAQACIQLAERLADAKNADATAKIARELIQTRTDATEQHIQCAALYPLTKALVEGAFDDLFAALKSDRMQFRAVARQLAVSVPGESVTKRWVDQLKTAQPDVRAEIFIILAQRKDKAAFPAAIEGMKDSDKTVRAAAIRALALGGSDAVTPLVSILEKSDADDQKLAAEVLAKLGGEGVNAKIAGAIHGAAVPVRKALIFALGARSARDSADVVLAAAKDADESVRIEALNALGTLGTEAQEPALLEFLAKSAGSEQQAAERALASISQRVENPAKAAAPVIAAFANSSGPVRCAMLRVLRKAGANEALPAFRTALKDNDAEVVDTAVRELSEWPDDDAAPDLLTIARETKKDNHNVLALRGYVRLAGQIGKTFDERAKMYTSALEVARRPDEKKLVLAAIGTSKEPAALKLLEPYFADASLKEEAVTATVSIGRSLAIGYPKEAEAALKKALNETTNERVKNDALDGLKRIGK